MEAVKTHGALEFSPYEAQPFPTVMNLIHKGKWIGLMSTWSLLWVAVMVEGKFDPKLLTIFAPVLIIVTMMAGPFYYLKQHQCWGVTEEGIRIWQGNYADLMAGLFNESRREANYVTIPFWQIRKVREEKLVIDPEVNKVEAASKRMESILFAVHQNHTPWGLDLRVMDQEDAIHLQFKTEHRGYSLASRQEQAVLDYVMRRATTAIKIYESK